MSEKREVVVLSGVRTAIGGYGGSLKDIPPSELAAQCVREAVSRAGIEPNDVGHVVFGHIIHTDPHEADTEVGDDAKAHAGDDFTQRRLAGVVDHFPALQDGLLGRELHEAADVGHVLTSLAGAPASPPRHYLVDGTTIRSWLLTVDHKRIAILYLVSVLVGLLLGGIFAMALRLQLLTPGPTVMDALTYNRVITLHGVP